LQSSQSLRLFKLGIGASVESSQVRLPLRSGKAGLPPLFMTVTSASVFFYTVAHIMTLSHGALMFVAAFFAGIVNSIAGGGMLLVFPMMIWLGLDPKVANATCTVALWPGLFGGLFGYRREMNDSSLILMRLGVVSVVGGGVGAWLLIATPSPIFARLVPFLILFATMLFMIQTPVTRWLRLPSVEGESTRGWWILVIIIQFFSATYGGYFGAGNGILMLAAMGLLGLHDIHRANGIKNFLGICINGVAVFSFSIAHMVSWRSALLMAVAATIGGYVGARTARRVGRKFIRRAIVVIGFTIAIVMLWRMR
jgi:uncharacterized membrane protein YfcA